MVTNMQVVHNILNGIDELSGGTEVKTEMLIAA